MSKRIGWVSQNVMEMLSLKPLYKIPDTFQCQGEKLSPFSQRVVTTLTLLSPTLAAAGSSKQNLQTCAYAQCQISSTGENPSANLLLIVPPGIVCSTSWNCQPYRSLLILIFLYLRYQVFFDVTKHVDSYLGWMHNPDTVIINNVVSAVTLWRK